MQDILDHVGDCFAPCHLADCRCRWAAYAQTAQYTDKRAQRGVAPLELHPFCALSLTISSVPNSVVGLIFANRKFDGKSRTKREATPAAPQPKICCLVLGQTHLFLSLLGRASGLLHAAPFIRFLIHPSIDSPLT